METNFTGIVIDPLHAFQRLCVFRVAADLTAEKLPVALPEVKHVDL